MEDQCVQTKSSERSGEEGFLPSTAAKTLRSVALSSKF